MMLLTRHGLQHPISNGQMLDKYPATMGEFVWTGFDYIGEPTPYYGDLTGLKPDSWDYKEVIKMLDKQGVTDVPVTKQLFWNNGSCRL